MRRSGSVKDLMMPWIGLLAGFAGWWLAHEFGFMATFDNCQTTSPGPLIAVSVLCIIVGAAGGLASWRIVSGDNEGSARRVIAIVSVGSAILFELAIVLPIIAALILPPCFQ